MGAFAREFNGDALVSWDKNNPGNAVRALFDGWALPGTATTSETPLRLAVRDGYLNFYVQGQSVAKLSWGGVGPQISIHRKYVDGRVKGAALDGNSSAEQHYVVFGPEKLAGTAVVPCVSQWIATAKTYAGAEKRFVDHLVAANAGVIDLEMGLPAGITSSGELKVAPRMDLVLAQAGEDGRLAIAFWEAKCSTNPELRANSEYAEKDDGTHRSGPLVIHQLLKYQRWMNQEGRLNQTAIAYRATAEILLSLFRAFRKSHSPDPECATIWQRLAAAKSLEVILPPGVVIGNYYPAAEGETAPDEAAKFQRAARSFEKHRRKLMAAGITVQELSSNGPHPLPSLLVGAVNA
jgi:hypothetical protein